MARKIHWKELLPGIIASLAVIAVVVSILMFARVGAIRGEKATIYIATGDVDGVLKGTEVWLAGQKVGEVTAIHFRSTAADTSNRLAVETAILVDRMSLIRKNSDAHIGPGGNLIGSMVVFISPGTTRSAALRSGDTIFAEPRQGVTGATETVTRLTAGVSGLATDMKALNDGMTSEKGTIGAFNRRGLPELARASAGVDRLKNRAMNGRGTVGLAMRGGLASRAGSVMSAADSLLTFALSGSGNIGRFRRDSSLVTTARGIAAQIDSLRAMASDPLGTLAKSRSDSSLARELGRTRAEIDALIRDIKKRPLRYIRL